MLLLTPSDEEENAYIPLRARSSRRQWWHLWKRQSFVDALEEIENLQGRTVVIGPPGCGRSSLLRRFARSLIPNQPSSDSRPVPILVDLRSYDPQEEFSVYLTRWLEQSSGKRFNQFVLKPLDALIEKGDVAFLFDGLDEGPMEDSRRRLSQIQHFMESFPLNRYIFTCGFWDKAFQDARDSTGFHHWLSVEELSDEQIEAIVNRSEPMNQLKPRVLKRERPDLLLLCRNPMRFHMLRQYCEDRRQFPQAQRGGPEASERLGHALTYFTIESKKNPT